MSKRNRDTVYMSCRLKKDAYGKTRKSYDPHYDGVDNHIVVLDTVELLDSSVGKVKKKIKRVDTIAHKRYENTRKYYEGLVVVPEVNTEQILGEKLWDVCIRHFVIGESMTEIAKEYGVTLSAVTNWLYGRQKSVYSKLKVYWGRYCNK